MLFIIYRAKILRDPRVDTQFLDYDANGNITHIEREVNDPDMPMDTTRESVRKFVWDEEDRLLGVDLRPESPAQQPHIAAYTYDANGERGIRYVPKQSEGVYSGSTAGYVQDMDIMLYPNALITVRPQEFPEHFDPMRLPPDYSYTTYTKHYYIGSERINSKLGTVNNLGVLCEEMAGNDLVNEMNTRVDAAGKRLNNLYQDLDKELEIEAPYLYSESHRLVCGFKSHNPKLYDAYWYHPDHLGSSSFITNTTGEISQHMEYLPFGETLVEEHLNSHNSPFKFNAKEYDAETGNYYYGARYYDPKWSMWLGVDPLAEMYPGISPFAYVLNNPIRYIDPTGMAVESKDCGICGIRKVFNKIFFPKEDQNLDGTLSSKVSRGTGWKLQKQNKGTYENNNETTKKSAKQSNVSSLNSIGVALETSLPQVKIQNQISISTKILSFEFDGREIAITGPQSIDFNFSTVGGVARNWNGQLSGGTNYILPMSNSHKQNLQAIANYLIANPQATIRFQYPTPGTNFHPAAVNDLREVYQMNFSQITNYLIQQGVTNPNRRILMNYSKGFDFIVNPGK